MRFLGAFHSLPVTQGCNCPVDKVPCPRHVAFTGPPLVWGWWGLSLQVWSFPEGLGCLRWDPATIWKNLLQGNISETLLTKIKCWMTRYLQKSQCSLLSKWVSQPVIHGLPTVIFLTQLPDKGLSPSWPPSLPDWAPDPLQPSSYLCSCCSATVNYFPSS